MLARLAADVCEGVFLAQRLAVCPFGAQDHAHDAMVEEYFILNLSNLYNWELDFCFSLCYNGSCERPGAPLTRSLAFLLGQWVQFQQIPSL